MVKKALLGQVGDTELRLLRIFRTVVRCGGLAAAELELNIGRSTVSRHLKELEQRLGLVLCRRGRAGFALTPDGERVLQGAEQVLEAIDGFRTEVHDLHAELQGTLAVGLFDKTVTNPRARIAAAIGTFRRRAPAVGLALSVGALNQLEREVMDGRLGLAVVPDHRRSDSLHYQPLFDEAMHLYCGAGHGLFAQADRPLRWEALRAAELAGLSFHSPNMDATHRYRLRRTASVTDQEAVATLILSGAYVGFLPDHYAQAFVQAGRLRRLGAAGDGPLAEDGLPRDPHYQVEFVAVSRASPPAGRLAREFLQVLREHHPPAQCLRGVMAPG
ncbi:LysR family transcriptional regulator [Ideonella livida]|uniref:LysR family transcriptional regulator n=1 Tax=Ideonella livida TaxID=2707176 RepID=A0A7C9TLQ9_9BURK|nr:LysR family transcriptional regulator [Ideonella livida]NDY93720.1 LysR family transcriptional regulator [Ideonella livida]